MLVELNSRKQKCIMADTLPQLTVSEAPVVPERLTAKRLAMEPLLLAARQAAALCSVSVSTWWRWDACGRIPRPLRLSPGCVRWQRETLTFWIQNGCPPRKEFEALQAAKNGKR